MEYSRPLSRAEASEYRRQRHGVAHAEATLAKMAVTGRGPRFRKVRRAVQYLPEWLDEYAAAIISKPVRSTSELREVA